MALTLHQSGHGHSHGGLSSHGHSHENGENHKAEKGHSHAHSHAHGHGPAGHQDMEEGQGVPRRPQANASVRAAFVHVVGDLLQSISVLVSALIIFFKVRARGQFGIKGKD